MAKPYLSYPENFRSSTFTAEVNGEPLFCCYGHVRKYPFAVGNVDLSYDIFEYNKEEIGFASFEITEGESVTVKVTPAFPVEKATVRPLNKKVQAAVINNTVTFKVTESGPYTVEFDTPHNAFHLFAEAPTDYGVSPTDSNVIYFGAGEHFPGNIILKDGDTLFIDEGAVVHGSVCAVGLKNIRILGKGIIDRSPEYFVSSNSLGSWRRQIFLHECENVEIDGVIFRDNPLWVIAMANSDDVRVNNVKMVGMWCGSTDGFDVVNSRNVSLTNSFLRNSDDNVTIKGFAPYEGMSNENITVEGCTFWCDWGVSLQIGAEACAERYRNITFKNCDIIHATHAAMSFQTGGYAEVSNIAYEDIRVEYSAHMREPIFNLGDSDEEYGFWQSTEKTERPVRPAPPPWADELFRVRHAPPETFKDMKYQPKNEVFCPWLIHIEVCEHWHDMLAPDKPFPDIHDVSYKNISVYTEEGVPVPPSAIRGYSPEVCTRNVSIENLTVNGKRLSGFEQANITVGPFAENVAIK